MRATTDRVAQGISENGCESGVNMLLLAEDAGEAGLPIAFGRAAQQLNGGLAQIRTDVGRCIDDR